MGCLMWQACREDITILFMSADIQQYETYITQIMCEKDTLKLVILENTRNYKTLSNTGEGEEGDADLPEHATADASETSHVLRTKTNIVR